MAFASAFCRKGNYETREKNKKKDMRFGVYLSECVP